jgi:EpsI family protein
MDVHIISYAAKSRDSEMINSLNRLFDPERWRQVEKRAGTVTLSAGHSLPYIALSIRSKTDQERNRIVWYWYLADDRPAINPFFVKLLETINLFAAEKSASSLVALSTSADDDTAAAQTIFEEFLARFCGVAISGTAPAQTPVCGR